MVRFLLAGDTHGNTGHVITLLDRAKAKNCDRIFQLGDFGYWEHEESGVKFLNDVERHAANRGVTVYFLDGNHDKTSLLLNKYQEERDDEGFILVRPHVRYAPRGHTWMWDGETFIALGGAYSVDKEYRLWLEKQRNSPEAAWFPEEEMTDEEFHAILLKCPFTTVDFMFTHDKPRMSNPGWNRKDLSECWPNQNRIQQAVEVLKPRLLVHGHLHHRYEDTITTSSGVTRVLGLDADPWTAQRFYRAENSWHVLNTDE